jgi:hypothetical protein
VSAGLDGDDAKIREAFAAYFKDFDIQLPSEIPVAGGLIKQAGCPPAGGEGRVGL